MAHALARLLTTLVASTASASQLAVRSAAPPGPAAGQCKCLNWKEVYASKRARCGVGNEYYFATQKTAPEWESTADLRAQQGKSVCDYFFERLDFDVCLNLNVGKDEGQWCYVDKACAALNGGAKLAGISWKKCHPRGSHGDALSRDIHPVKLNAYAWDFDVNFGILHKFAYPCEKGHEGQIWPHVARCWGMPQDADYESLPGWLLKKCNSIQGYGSPWSFDTRDDQNLPHVIVMGRKVYKVDTAAWKNFSHPGSWETVTCVAQCDEDLKR